MLFYKALRSMNQVIIKAASLDQSYVMFFKKICKYGLFFHIFSRVVSSGILVWSMRSVVTDTVTLEHLLDD